MHGHGDCTSIYAAPRAASRPIRRRHTHSAQRRVKGRRIHQAADVRCLPMPACDCDHRQVHVLWKLSAAGTSREAAGGCRLRGRLVLLRRSLGGGERGGAAGRAAAGPTQNRQAWTVLSWTPPQCWQRHCLGCAGEGAGGNEWGMPMPGIEGRILPWCLSRRSED